MKSTFRLTLTAAILLLILNVNFGQTAPNLGTTSSFALFTAGGAFSVTGASSVTGNVGTNVGAFTGFPPGSVVGQIHVADLASAQAATDVAVAYSDLTQGGTVIGVGLGNGQVLVPGVYQTGAASTLNGNLTLDGGDDPSALFIIRIGGAFATGASSTVSLINSASLCNVYWQIGGQFDLETGSVFRGTLIADGPINLLGNSSLLGRGLSKAGAISLSNNVVTNSCACIAPAAPTASVTIQPTSIVSTGTIKVTAPANGPGISYTITGTTPVVAPVTNTTGLFTGLAPGIYNVTATIAENVSPATTLTVNEVPGAPAAPTASVTIQPTSIVSTGTIKVTAPANGPGISYTITGTTPVVAPVTNTTGLFTGLAPGIYNVTATIAENVSPATTLTVNEVPGAPAAPTASVTIQPTSIVSTGTIKVTAPANGPGISYTITGTTPVVAPVTNTTGLFTGLAPGIYNVTATIAESVSPATTLTVNAVTGAPAAPTASVTIQPTCIVSTGKIKVTAPANGPGISYTLTGTTPVVAPVTNTTGLFTGLAPGIYNVTATIAESVSPATTLTVNAVTGAPAAPTASVTIQPTCIVSTGKIKVTAPANGPGISYTLTGTTPVVAPVTNTTGLFTGLAPGVYAVTATNAECVSAATSLTINAVPGAPSAPKLVSVIQPTCKVPTGSKVLNGLPETGTWTLNPGGIKGTGTSTTVSGLAPGTYSYTVTNAEGCTSAPSASFVINALSATPSAPKLVSVIQPTCKVPTGSKVLNGLPETGTWTLNPGGIKGTGTSTTVSGLAPGTYSYTVTNAEGCTSAPTASFVINALSATPAAPKLVSVTQPTCEVPTGSKVLNGLPETGTWTLNPGGIKGTGTSTTVSGLAPGTYSYTVTNAEGCTSPPSASFGINALSATPSAPTLGSITQPTCIVATGSVVLKGLSETGTWTLNPGGITGTGTSTTISGLAPGSYSYTVTNAEGCTSAVSANVVITAPPIPAAPTVTLTQTTCDIPTGTIIVTSPKGIGMTYSIDGSTYTNTTGIFTLLPAGTYTVTAKNADGCISSR